MTSSTTIYDATSGAPATRGLLLTETTPGRTRAARAGDAVCGVVAEAPPVDLPGLPVLSCGWADVLCDPTAAPGRYLVPGPEPGVGTAADAPPLAGLSLLCVKVKRPGLAFCAVGQP